MPTNNKSIFHLSLSKDVAEFINKYAEDKGLNKSVAAERILLKGIEQITLSDFNRIAEEVAKILGNDISINTQTFQEKIKEENENNFDLKNENDLAMLDIFNSIPD